MGVSLGTMADKVMGQYKARWSNSLIIISSLVTALCVGIAIGMIRNGSGILPWAAVGPLLLVSGAALFTIRGYTVSPEALLIHRLFWTTRLPLTGLESAQFEPDAMRRSIRTLGNGGLFSFTGSFRNKTIGSYRAFVTDPHRTVVLRFPKRTVVVSPDSPETFLQEIAAPVPPLEAVG